ncbi:DUF4129 domain-containing transglutaminase family protein [Chloroflexota bacterium]
MLNQVETTQKYEPPGLRFDFRFGKMQEWGSLAIVFVTLTIAVRSIEYARWITPQPSLMLVLVLAVLTGLLLAKSRLPGKARYSLVLVLGAIIAVWQSSSILIFPETTSRISNLVISLNYWWQAISTVRPSEGITHFATFLVIAIWIAGYLSTWYILRRQNPWMAICLGAVIILVNLSNLPQWYHYFLPIYLVAALLLIGQTSLARQHDWFKKYGKNYANRGILYFLASVICIGILAVSVAWFVPGIQDNRFNSIIGSNIPQGENVAERWLNIFAAVPGKWNIIKDKEQVTLSFDAPIDRSYSIQFLVTSDLWSSYWRSRRYDFYNSRGWTSGNTTDHMVDAERLIKEDNVFPNRVELMYTVENRIKTNVLITAGEFVSSDIPVLLQTLTPDASGRDVFPAATLFGVAQAAEAAPIQEKMRDIVAVITPRLLGPNQHYTITTSVTLATPDELREAGEEYPQWILDHYLQLPYSLPERVGQFSKIIVGSEEVDTPYDKAVAIREYISRFTYDNDVSEALPEDADGVDYFLFKEKAGNCNNFASTMVVMLRSIDVPARLSTGYLLNEWNQKTGDFVIRARDYHAWAEIYFPGYGWIAFEATPIGTGTEEGISVGGGVLNIGEAGAYLEDWDDDEWYYNEFGGSRGTSSAPSFWQRSSSIVISGSILAMLVVGLILYRRLQRFLGGRNVYEVYAKMCFLASLIKSGPNPQETPLEYCGRLALILPVQAEAIDDIAQSYIENQFSQRKGMDFWGRMKLQQSWNNVSRDLLKMILRLKK